MSISRSSKKTSIVIINSASTNHSPAPENVDENPQEATPTENYVAYASLSGAQGCPNGDARVTATHYLFPDSESATGESCYSFIETAIQNRDHYVCDNKKKTYDDLLNDFEIKELPGSENKNNPTKLLILNEIISKNSPRYIGPLDIDETVFNYQLKFNGLGGIETQKAIYQFILDQTDTTKIDSIFIIFLLEVLFKSSNMNQMRSVSCVPLFLYKYKKDVNGNEIINDDNLEYVYILKESLTKKMPPDNLNNCVYDSNGNCQTIKTTTPGQYRFVSGPDQADSIEIRQGVASWTGRFNEVQSPQTHHIVQFDNELPLHRFQEFISFSRNFVEDSSGNEIIEEQLDNEVPDYKGLYYQMTKNQFKKFVYTLFANSNLETVSSMRLNLFMSDNYMFYKLLEFCINNEKQVWGGIIATSDSNVHTSPNYRIVNGETKLNFDDLVKFVRYANYQRIIVDARNDETEKQNILNRFKQYVVDLNSALPRVEDYGGQIFYAIEDFINFCLSGIQIKNLEDIYIFNSARLSEPERLDGTAPPTGFREKNIILYIIGNKHESLYDENGTQGMGRKAYDGGVGGLDYMHENEILTILGTIGGGYANYAGGGFGFFDQLTRDLAQQQNIINSPNSNFVPDKDIERTVRIIQGTIQKEQTDNDNDNSGSEDTELRSTFEISASDLYTKYKEHYDNLTVTSDIHEETRNIVKRSRARVTSLKDIIGESGKGFEFKHVDIDGEEFPVPVLHMDGKPLHWYYNTNYASERYVATQYTDYSNAVGVPDTVSTVGAGNYGVASSGAGNYGVASSGAGNYGVASSGAGSSGAGSSDVRVTSSGAGNYGVASSGAGSSDVRVTSSGGIGGGSSGGGIGGVSSGVRVTSYGGASVASPSQYYDEYEYDSNWPYVNMKDVTEGHIKHADIDNFLIASFVPSSKQVITGTGCSRSGPRGLSCSNAPLSVGSGEITCSQVYNQERGYIECVPDNQVLQIYNVEAREFHTVYKCEKGAACSESSTQQAWPYVRKSDIEVSISDKFIIMMNMRSAAASTNTVGSTISAAIAS